LYFDGTSTVIVGIIDIDSLAGILTDTCHKTTANSLQLKVHVSTASASAV